MGSSLPPSPLGAGQNKKLAIRNDRIALPNRLNFRRTLLGAFAWAATTVYAAGAQVSNAGMAYFTAAGGTSASSGGPTGLGNSITDGTVTWQCLGFANAPVVTSGTAATIAKFLPSCSFNSFYVGTINPYFTYTKCNPVAAGIYVSANNVTLTPSPTYGFNMMGVSFYCDDASIELVLGGNGGSFQVKVDDQYALPDYQLIPNNSTQNYYKLNFGSALRRRIDIIGNNINFGGVNISATGSLEAAPIRGPRGIMQGDSFTQRCYWVQAFSDYMGWDDIWPSGVGGRGYLATNAGTAPTFRQAFSHDVAQFNPEFVYFFGSLNDSAQTPSAMSAEAALLYAQARASLPNALLLYGFNMSGGARWVTPNYLQVHDAVVAAASTAGLIAADPMSIPLPAGYTPLATQLSSTAISAGSGAFVTPVPLNQGSHYRIGNELVQIASTVGIGGFPWSNYTNTTVGQVQLAHNIGDAVTQVNDMILTGTGNMLHPAGNGNSDVLVSTDQTHPIYPIGDLAWGECIANCFIKALAPN